MKRLLGLFVVGVLLGVSQTSFAQASASHPSVQQALTYCTLQASAAGQAGVFDACLAANGIILGGGGGDYTGLEVKPASSKSFDDSDSPDQLDGGDAPDEFDGGNGPDFLNGGLSNGFDGSDGPDFFAPRGWVVKG